MGKGNSDTGVTGRITNTYATPGIYTVSVTGDFPRIYFADVLVVGDLEAEKILTVEQWGDIQWASMHRAFAGCGNLRINATDAPDLSAVTDMSYCAGMP